MTVRELLAELQHLPRDLEIAFEAGCEDYCERESTSSSSRAAGSTRTWGPAATSHHDGSRPGPMAEVDPDQEAALRRLRAAFGFIEILRIVDHDDGQDQDDDELTDEGEPPAPA
jgi:hypothetical protein